MKLPEVMADPAAPDIEISSLAYDNRQVGDGTLFFCVPGFTRDGHEFASDAVQRGAAALVVERPVDAGVPEVTVPSVREAMAPAAARFYRHPSRRLAVVGVTGTNGKTTTAFLTRALLEAHGVNTGLLGTVKSIVGGAEREVQRTTPEAIDLQRELREMVDSGDKACVMEVSSHALALGRADAIHFEAVVFTNLTQDHLDFHESMEDYFEAKRRLLASDPAPRARIVNVDDRYGRRLAEEFPDALTFAIDRPADFRARDVRTSFAGSVFTAETPTGVVELRSPLPGRFNVLNVLAAIAAAHALTVDLETIERAVPGAGAVPGRFQPVDEGQGFAVLVDYAHSPDSLANVLKAARELAGLHDVYCVFGCGGDRDRDKRPKMGRIARSLADVVVVTSDNPRSEDPETIIREVLAGAGHDTPWFVDRREAIGYAVSRARPGDVVVIAGKGHEQGQELKGGRKVPFDDVAVAREALRGPAAAASR